jgi:hypothetical protein
VRLLLLLHNEVEVSRFMGVTAGLARTRLAVHNAVEGSRFVEVIAQ